MRSSVKYIYNKYHYRHYDKSVVNYTTLVSFLGAKSGGHVIGSSPSYHTCWLSLLEIKSQCSSEKAPSPLIGSGSPLERTAMLCTEPTQPLVSKTPRVCCHPYLLRRFHPRRARLSRIETSPQHSHKDYLGMGRKKRWKEMALLVPYTLSLVFGLPF